MFISRGFYPKGRGEVILTVNPIVSDLKAIELNVFGDHPSIRGIIFISGPKHQTNKNQVHIFSFITLKYNNIFL